MQQYRNYFSLKRSIYHQGYRFLVLLCLFLLKPGLSKAQDFTAVNHAYWYQPNAPLQINLMAWQSSPDSIKIKAQLTLNDNQDITVFRLLAHPRQQLDTANGSLPIPMYTESRSEEKYVFWANVLKSDNLQFILLEVQDLSREGVSYWSYVSLQDEYTFGLPPFYLSQAGNSSSLFRGYIAAGQEIKIKGSDNNHTLFYYPTNFDPAAPPMSAAGNTSTTMEVDSTLTIPADSSFSLQQEGLYFAQHDTTQLSGKSFRVTNRFYPEVGTLEEFAGPIRYLSTNEEWRQLQASEFSKKAIDRFWLKIARTEDRAKNIIKDYYDRVALANEYFTNYKEGWKTDQGMIYILYGNPDDVQVLADREIWIYLPDGDLPEIKFTFVRVKNPFSDRHLVLLRSKNYTKAHYQTVSQWRRGRKTL